MSDTHVKDEKQNNLPLNNFFKNKIQITSYLLKFRIYVFMKVNKNGEAIISIAFTGYRP